MCYRLSADMNDPGDFMISCVGFALSLNCVGPRDEGKGDVFTRDQILARVES